eukprot:200060_1
MTVGIGAQRTVRNQVICSTALGYNNYTLSNLERSVGDYAVERNTDAWGRNLIELQRVDQFNQLFCQGWVAYMAASRDTSSTSPDPTWMFLNTSDTTSTLPITRTQAYYTVDVLDTNNPIDMSTIGNLFDNDADTYWTPNISLISDQDVMIDFNLPKIRMSESDADSTWWNIVQISFNWRFIYDASNTPSDKSTPITFDIQTEGNNTGVLSTIPYPNGNTYSPMMLGNPGTRQTSESTIKIVTIADEINTPRVRIIFRNVSRWGTEYYLNDIAIAGHAPRSQIVCPEIQFKFWEFDASPTNNWNATVIPNLKTPTPDQPDAVTYYDADGTYVELCPQITPIHGLMYRGFVRSWLNEQLIIGHEPFILAIRNIALSPFYIA